MVMKNVDFYTKAVLTVIAVCLVILTLRNTEIIPPAKASAPAETESLSSSGPMEVRIVGVSYGTKIPVQIENTVPVKIEGVSFGTKVPVTIEDIPRAGLDVNIKSPKVNYSSGGVEVYVTNYKDFE